MTEYTDKQVRELMTTIADLERDKTQLLEALEGLVDAPNGAQKAIREAWDKAYDALAAARGE
jgi:hemoglobin-like flavoprotein